jgi:hypothetical protein
MWLFCLGIFLGIGIYWTIALIMSIRVLDRHIAMSWSSEEPEHNQKET